MNNEQILSAALAPKSDQLNADDLIVSNLVIKVTKVIVNLQSEAQKIWVHYEGDNGKPWKPSKSMGRVLAEILGGDFTLWTGQYIELFKNKEIMFGKDKCGGIQIAAMSALKNATTVIITTKRGVKSKITILPLLVQQPTTQGSQKTSNPDLKKIGDSLREASKKGMIALNLEAALIPDKYRESMMEWLQKCIAHATQVDIARTATQEPPLRGFTPIQPKVEEMPPPTEAPETLESYGVEDF